MDGFLKLNKHKLRFAFVATSLIFLSLALILLIIGYFNEQFPDPVLLITILLVAGIGFPIFIIAIAYLEWLSKRRVRKRAFSKSPYDKLPKIGFTKTFINEKTKWFFTEETKEGFVNNFKIKCDITRENSKTIQFKALVEHRQIDKDEFKRLEHLFNKYDVIFDFEGLTKLLDINNPAIASVQQLESELMKFTELLKNENFEPIKARHNTVYSK
ncbi:hypothetical protein [Persicobacter psychrovividus]|uniref:DUF3137 domain-containing protein n=1 Tax=Persicobacter psychrovividus TaxID=387638 RepID=A0ABN6LE04_9BACT|nr:hypothetical protein PEPS_36980 [Persicobacter psychrovividus]